MIVASILDRNDSQTNLGTQMVAVIFGHSYVTAQHIFAFNDIMRDGKRACSYLKSWRVRRCELNWLASTEQQHDQRHHHDYQRPFVTQHSDTYFLSITSATNLSVADIYPSPTP